MQSITQKTFLASVCIYSWFSITLCINMATSHVSHSSCTNSLNVRKFKRRVRANYINLTLWLLSVVGSTYPLAYLMLLYSYFTFVRIDSVLGKVHTGQKLAHVFRKLYFFFQLGNDVIFEKVFSIFFSTHCPFRYVW